MSDGFYFASSSSSSGKPPSPTEQHKSQIDFQFLNFSHPSEAKAGAARKAVRSHVTRQQHQRENAAAAKRARSYQSGSEQSDVPPLRHHAATFPQGSASMAERQETSTTTQVSSPEVSPSPSPAASPTSTPPARIDPKDLYPQEWHPYLRSILEHYITTIAVDSPDIDRPDAPGALRQRFFPFILTDAASLNAVMLVAASHYSRARGPRSHGIDLLQLRGMAISEINSALANPARATSDQLIAAVAQMAYFEALFGDRSVFNTHMTGLLRIVSLRGGLPALGLDGVLERLLLWIDVNTAYIIGSHVYFDRVAFPSTAAHPRPDPIRFMAGVAQRPRP